MRKLLLFAYFSLTVFGVLAQQQQSSRYDLQHGLIFYLPLDNNPKDSTDKAIMGEVHGATPKGSMDRCGLGNGCYYFDGVDDYIDYGNDEHLNHRFTGLTISAWVYAMESNSKEFSTLVGKWAFKQERDHFALFLNHSNVPVLAVGDPKKMEEGVFGRTRIEPRQWYHIVGVWKKGHESYIYVNGRLDGKTQDNGKSINSASDLSLKIGRQIDGQNRAFKGYLDDVRIYKKALHADEIRFMYSVEKSKCFRLNLEGRILDSFSHQPIPNAKITITNLTSRQTGEPFPTKNPMAQYDTAIALGYDYEIKVDADTYVSETGRVSTLGLHEADMTIKKDFFLHHIDNVFGLSGMVVDTLGNPMGNIDVYIDDLTSGDMRKHLKSGFKDGKFSSYIENGHEYALYAEADGYYAVNAMVDSRDWAKHSKIEKTITLIPLEVGATIRLNNIFFDTDKATLKEKSNAELDRLVKIMEQYPGLEIEIAGHTDSDGSDEHNEGLSERRATAVYDYLVSKNVSAGRGVPKGYGEKRPVATNDTADGKQLNRRVEFVVLKK